MSHIRSRFTKPANELVIDFTSSLPFDWRLYNEDIQGSIAHARMLGRQGIITVEDAVEIEAGLVIVKQELDEGRFTFRPELEDIHMAVEARLFEIIGNVAGKLHTGRSRNDQIALDMRLFMKNRIQDTLKAIRELQAALVNQAEANTGTIMPGCTHLQHAQPVLFAHHMLAYYEMLERDYQRITGCFERTDFMPLGSGALAGTGFDIDRQFVAGTLGFSRITANSMDAVSDRDFVIEYLAAASLIMMHISRLAEEIILWSTSEYSYIELDEAYSTGSSIMPQKKNPDVAELARGKTGRVYGHLTAMLTTMKALPLSYNRDLQEDKEGLFDTVDTVLMSLRVFAGMVDTMKVNREVLAVQSTAGYTLATDVADYLVKKGVSFRAAHHATGQLVNYAARENKALEELSLKEYRQFCPDFGEDVLLISRESSIQARNIPGGTAEKQVTQAVKQAQAALNKEQG